MPIDVDLSAWGSMEALSVHEIACLGLGFEPPDLKAGRFIPPSVPEDLSHIDQSDIDKAYWRTVNLLQRAVDEKVIELSPSGRIRPKDAVAYLEQSAKQRNDDWAEQCEFAKVVKSLQPKSDETAELLFKIETLERDLKRYQRRVTYSTPMLELVNEVIDEFYAGKTNFPKQETVFEFLRDKKIGGRQLSQKKIGAIWAVASDPSQEKGGQKPRKK